MYIFLALLFFNVMSSSVYSMQLNESKTDNVLVKKSREYDEKKEEQSFHFLRPLTVLEPPQLMLYHINTLDRIKEIINNPGCKFFYFQVFAPHSFKKTDMPGVLRLRVKCNMYALPKKFDSNNVVNTIDSWDDEGAENMLEWYKKICQKNYELKKLGCKSEEIRKYLYCGYNKGCLAQPSLTWDSKWDMQQSVKDEKPN